MFNLEPFLGKTIRSIQRRQGNEQVIIYFEDDSFLIVTADTVGYGLYAGGFGSRGKLTFQGRAVNNN